MFPDLKDYVLGKSVAIVGNAQSLLETNHGEEIDSHAVVIRINQSANWFKDDHRYSKYDLDKAVGKKINIWAIWDHTKFTEYLDNIPIVAKEMFLKPTIHMLNLALHYRRMGFVYKPTDGPMCEIGKKYKNELFDKFGNPSSGLTVIHILNECTPSNVNLYGFDFKSTPTFSTPQEPITQKGNEIECQFGHKWINEGDFVKNLCKKNYNWVLK